MSGNPFGVGGDNSGSGASSVQWAIIVGLAVLVVSLGGYLSGCAIDAAGSFGTVALWATGGLAGLIASKLVSPQQPFGWILAGAVVLAFLVAEVFWIHWNIKGAEEILVAASKLPLFFKEFTMDAIIGGVLTFFGASSAYRQAGQRYQYVRVVQQ